MDFILFLVLVKVNYNSYNNTVALRPDNSQLNQCMSLGRYYIFCLKRGTWEYFFSL